MTNKTHIVNVDAAQEVAQNLANIEMKIKMMKQYVEPQFGVVTDTKLVSSLFNSIQHDLTKVNTGLIKFL